MSNPVKSDIGSTDVNIAIAFALFNNLTRATHPLIHVQSWLSQLALGNNII